MAATYGTSTASTVRPSSAPSAARTWIVHRAFKDKRVTGGERWQPIGWVNHTNEEQARREAHKMFGRYDEENLRLLETTPGCGWLA